jgi:hypothetical protein
VTDLPEEDGSGMSGFSGLSGSSGVARSRYVTFTFWATRNGWRRNSRTGLLDRIGNDFTLLSILRGGSPRRIVAQPSNQGSLGATTETLYIQGWADVSGLPYGTNVRSWLTSQLLDAISRSGIQITRYGFNSLR